ncbi:MAG: GyrI-like domain-containing protein [Bacteroidia bacterium]|nr:GyrI-like domain-containing protein [Bacteroidia bacterium]
MSKLDLKTVYRHLYRPSAARVEEVEVPEFAFLMADGQGDPNTSPAYAEAVEALFSLSYALKFKVRQGPLALDYAVMPLEGLWWADDLAAYETGDRSQWRWTMMIHQPEAVTEPLVAETLEALRRKKPLPGLDRLRFEVFEEGRCAQTLHIGPFSAEGPTIGRVHAFIGGRGSLRGKHHEIYLSDIRRAAPEAWKTVIRQPMA